MTDTNDSFCYESNATFAELAKRILEADRILLLTHAKPDGDAIGSVLALHRALQGLDRRADIFLMGPIETSLRALAETSPIHLVEDDFPDDDYDLIIIADTGSWKQLEPLSEWLRPRHERIIGFDHHAQGQNVAALRLVDTDMASTTQLLVTLMDELALTLTGEIGGIAEALFIGLATDTGWFKFQNADAGAFAVATRLLETGVDKSRLYQIIEETARPSRMALLARALLSLRYVRNGEVAIMSLTREDFQETGGVLEELTGVVNEPMQVGTVRVSILLTQVETGVTKISFRAKPAGDDHPFTDVNQLARQFEGGGHPHAAGAKVRMDLEPALRRVVAALE